MRIAVASKGGTEVDQHFGHAERFLIYELGEDTIEPAGEVSVERYCSFDPNHPMRPRQLSAIVAALKGCRAVITERIGDYPREELEKSGLVHITASGPVGEALCRALHTLSGCSCGK